MSRGFRIINPQSASRAGAVMIAVVFIVTGFVSTMPTGVNRDDAPVTEFSAERAMEHVRVIASEPHPMGSPQIQTVRDYLVDQAEALGMEVDLQTAVAPDPFGDGGTTEVVNVIAWIPGADHTRAVLLIAHYDTVPTTAGGNDNTSAVAALLETARALQAGPALANDIVFLFTDGEEPSGRFGSSAFFDLPGIVDRLGLAVNFEANGGSGASTLVQTSGPQHWVVGEWSGAAPTPVAFSFLTDLADLIGEIGTDFDGVVAAGLPGLHFAYLRGSPIYHTMADDIDAVSLNGLQHHGSNALAIARHFGNLDLTEIPEAGESVFFTMGPFLVRYPVWLGVIVALLGSAVLGVGMQRSKRSGSMTVAGVLRSAAAAAAGGLTGAVAVTLLWMAVAGQRSSMGLYESYLYLALLVALGVWAARVVERRIGGGGNEETRQGRVALWVLLSLLTALLLPGFSYLFGWAALVSAAGLLWRARSPVGALVRFAVVSAPALVLMTPGVDYLFQFASPRPGNPGSEVTFTLVVAMLLALAAAGMVTTRWHQVDPPGGRPDGSAPSPDLQRPRIGPDQKPAAG